MSKLISTYEDLGSALLPPWSGRQKYMHTFDLGCPEMADGFDDYKSVVNLLYEAAGYQSGQAHMTVDESIVQAGMSQRRPDAHVDGWFLPDAGLWYHPTPGPVWAHFCNNVPYDRMAVIIASSVPGCIAYTGEFEGQPKENGDLEHIRGQLGKGTLLPANRGFLLSPDCVHESLRFTVPTKRSFLRIALEP